MGHPDQGTSFPTSRIFLEQVMETIADGYTALDADWRYVYVNRAAYALLHRDPADSLIGKRIWDEFDIAPEFAAAYHRARDEGVEVEVTGYYEPWDTWIYNRVLPTAGGLSIFGRNLTEQTRVRDQVAHQDRLVRTVRAISLALAVGGADDRTVLGNAAAAIVETWPVRGLRVLWPGGSADAGVLSGPVRAVPLEAAGVVVGSVELVGEEDPVDPDLLELLAVRLSAVVSGT
jgi:hypothetical protein